MISKFFKSILLVFSLILLFFSTNILSQTEGVSSSNTDINNALCEKTVVGSELKYNDAILISNLYENRKIYYNPFFNGNNGGYEGRNYYMSILANGKTSTNFIQQGKQHYFDLIKDTKWDIDVPKGMKYFDKVNRDCNFELDNIYTEESTTTSGKVIRFIDATFNSTENLIEQNIYTFYKNFEYKHNGNIETFNITSYTGGKWIFGFIAQSTFTEKKYLFTYCVISKSLQVYDLSKLNITNTKRYNTIDCSIHSISEFNVAEYVFLQFGDKILPIMAWRNEVTKTFESCETQLGSHDDIQFNGWSGKIYSIWDKWGANLNGFVNVYSEGNTSDFKVKLYGEKLNLLWETSISNIRITDVRECNGFIVIGGFTQTRGFVGFPNPRVIVINKATQEMTYDNVIPLKNGTIDKISSDYQGNIEITTSIWSKNWNETKHFPLSQQIILDRLNEKGVFKNNLFIK